MIHIEPSKYVKGCILINGKALPVELYNKFKNKFTIPEQEAIENYLKVKKMKNRKIKIIDVSKPNGVIIENLGIFDKPIKQACKKKKVKNYCKNFVNNLQVFVN